MISSAAMPQEHYRLSARYRVRAPVTIRVAGIESSQRADLVDLGLSGACIALNEALIAGMDAIVEIRTPLLWDPLRIRGRIVWANWNSETGVFRAGLRFQHDSPVPLFSLFEFISAQGFE